MFGQRRDKSTRLKLNTTNIELKYKAQATDKTIIQRDGEDTAHHEEIDRHVKWHRSTTTRLKKRSNNEGSGDHWFISSVRPRPSSACSVTQMPKTIAFMSKCGKISTDLRRRVRPATADICAKRPGAARGGTYHNEDGKRLSHSAGLLRMKERLGTNGAETKVLKPSFEIKETKIKDAWASNVKKENRILSNIEDDRIHKSVNQTPEPNQDKPDNIMNLEQDDNADIVVDPNETITFTGKSDKSVVRDQMAVQAVPLVAIIFEDEINACKDTDRERLKLEKIRERKVELKVNESAGMHQPEESEMLKMDERVSQTTGLWRKSAIFVCSILRLQLHMSALSSEVTSRSATEEQWHAVNTSRQVKELVFNKDIYAKSKAVSRVPKWARMILDKSPEERTERDVRRLHALLRGLKSFDKFTEKIQFAMCRSFTYQW